MLIRRDPRDLSRIDVYGPADGNYLEVGYREPARPPVSRREHRLARSRLSGRISRCGGTPARTLLHEAAVVLLARVKRASPLKDWAQATAKRSGTGKARVALARKLSVTLHSIWRFGGPFRWPEQAAAA